jgi:hypothetical protein
MKIIIEFEDGMANHYVHHTRALNNEEELLLFAFRHVDIGQVLFLFICWILRKADPEGSLRDVRFPSVVPDQDMNQGNMGRLGRIGSKSTEHSHLAPE